METSRKKVQRHFVCSLSFCFLTTVVAVAVSQNNSTRNLNEVNIALVGSHNAKPNIEETSFAINVIKKKKKN